MKLIELMNTPAFKLFNRDWRAGNKGVIADPLSNAMKNRVLGTGETISGKVDFSSMGDLRKKTRALSKNDVRANNS